MKDFGKCLRTDLRSIRGEVLTAYMTVILFSFLGVNPLLSSELISSGLGSSEPGASGLIALMPVSFGRFWEEKYLFAIPAAALVIYCFFRVFKRLFYTTMFTEGAVLYRTFPVSEKSAAMSKFVVAGAALTGQQFILLGLKWYELHRRLTKFSSLEFRGKMLENYNGFMESLGGELLKQAAASFAFAAMLFAAIAVCKTAKQTTNNSAFGRGFFAALAIAAVSLAVVWGTGAF